MLTSCFVLLLTSHLLKIKVIYRLSCTIFFLTLLYYSHLLVVCQFPAGLQDFFFKGFLFTDYYYFFFKGITVGLTLVLLLLCQNILQNTQNNILKEFLLLILIATFFMLMLLSSNDFFFSYLSLEGLSFSLYILAASLYYNRLSIESALKYFILGGISSSILLYAISLILITTSSLDFFSIKYFFLEESNTGTTLDTIFIMACLCISFLFKLSAFPCHI
jgi:NADH:ubiquinone oxidoreductase subunit 2 (subunit N)